MDDTWITSGNAVEWVTAAAFLVLLIAELAYLYDKRNYFALAMTLPTAVLILFYTVLALDVEPIAFDIDLRLAIFRPSQIALIVFTAAFLLNGRINRAQMELGRWIHRLRNR